MAAKIIDGKTIAQQVRSEAVSYTHLTKVQQLGFNVDPFLRGNRNVICQWLEGRRERYFPVG